MLTAVKVVVSCVPTAVIAAMITTEMSAAMSAILDGGRAGFVPEERKDAGLLTRGI